MVRIDEREIVRSAFLKRGSRVKCPKCGVNMNLKEFIENRDQVVAGGRKQATVRVTHLPHENQPAFITDSSKSWALWRLSLVLKEISENSKPHGEENQPPRLIPAKDGDGRCNVRKNGVYIISNL